MSKSFKEAQSALTPITFISFFPGVGARGMIRYFDPDYSKDDLFLYAQKTLTSENDPY